MKKFEIILNHDDIYKTLPLSNVELIKQIYETKIKILENKK